jgi:hypothetical protein
MNTLNTAVLKPVPVPRDLAKWTRKSPFSRTLNDQVEEIHRALMDQEHEDYITFLDAVHDSQAVEGSLAIDNSKAAEIIRNYALDAEHPNSYLAKQKLATIVKSLGVVLRRYNQSRVERRNTVSGQTVATDHGE